MLRLGKNRQRPRREQQRDHELGCRGQPHRDRQPESFTGDNEKQVSRHDQHRQKMRDERETDGPGVENEPHPRRPTPFRRAFHCE